MRQLKFRVWDGKIMTYPETVEIGVNGWNGLTSASYQLDSGGYCTSAHVMQFTGLLDKQGKECYWDDWVSDGINPEFLVTPDYHLLARLSEIEFEVIGNIYENPELLEVG